VDPLPVAAFLEEYWDKESLHLPHNQRQGTTSLDLGLGLAELRREAECMPPGAVQARFRSRSTGQDRHVDVAADQIETLIDGGLSVRVRHLQRAHEGVALLMGRLRAELELPGHLTCDAHISSACAGQASQLETHPLLYLQLAGSQTWAYGRGPALPFPPAALPAVDGAIASYQRRYPWARVSSPRDEKLRTSQLQPGDVLFLPSGTWHEALATDHSLALAISFRSPALHRVAAAALEEALVPFASWRWLARAGLPEAERMTAQLREVIQRLDPAALAARCRPAPALATPGTIGDERLEPRRPLRHQVTVDEMSGASELAVLGGDLVAALPLEMMLLVSRLVRSAGFSASEAMMWPGVAAAYSAGEVRGSLATLLKAGLLRRAQIPI
jgi:hypothetical protein